MKREGEINNENKYKYINDPRSIWFLRTALLQNERERPHQNLYLKEDEAGIFLCTHTHGSMRLFSPLQFKPPLPILSAVNTQTYQTTKGAVGRSRKEVLRRPNLDDLAVAEHGDAVRDLDGRPAVGDQEGCSVLRQKGEAKGIFEARQKHQGMMTRSTEIKRKAYTN